MAGIGSNSLRAVLKEQGWSHSKLVAELRRRAAATGEALPKTESLLTLVSRWVNNHQQPDGFYRDLLARALQRPAAELFGEDDQAAELETGAEPWRLARVLELSSVGAAALEAMELAVADFARRYPSTPPATLLDPVATHYRDVSRLLEGALPIAHRRRLVVVAGVLAGLAGNLAFDLKQRPRAEAYFTVALQAAQEAESADLGAWSLAMRSILPAYHGDPAAALALIQQGQAFAGQAVTATRRAWLAAMEAKAHAGLGDARPCSEALGQATDAIENAGPAENRLGTDFFDVPRLLAFKGTCALLLHQPRAARAVLAEGLALRPPSDVKGRSLARLDLAAAYVQEREPEQAHATALEALSIPPQYRVGPILQRARRVQADLAPWSDERPVRDLADQLRAILAA
jgi:tetratricopeptide (TPR) repeat protein